MFCGISFAGLDDPLSDGNYDIKGVSTEFYDVYYSDEQGNADIDENTPGFFDSWNDDGNLPRLRMSTRKSLPSPLFFTKRTINMRQELQI